jgi:hypothetical protein
MTLAFLDRPPSGWFALDVMRRDRSGKWDWVALMVDVRPDQCLSEAALLTAREAWVSIPGKHRTRDTAWNALESMISTRH